MKKIVLFGTESTGKTTLAKQLANYFETVYNPEYLRLYLEVQQKHVTIANPPESLVRPDEVTPIALGQIVTEDLATQWAKNGLVFLDTNLRMNKIYAQYFFKSYPSWIDDELAKRKYDLYLFTNLDVNWEYDEMRDNPDVRPKMHQIFENELQTHQLSYQIVSGVGKQRFENAVRAIEKVLQRPNGV